MSDFYNTLTSYKYKLRTFDHTTGHIMKGIEHLMPKRMSRPHTATGMQTFHTDVVNRSVTPLLCKAIINDNGVVTTEENVITRVTTQIPPFYDRNETDICVNCFPHPQPFKILQQDYSGQRKQSRPNSRIKMMKSGEITEKRDNDEDDQESWYLRLCSKRTRPKTAPSGGIMQSKGCVRLLSSSETEGGVAARISELQGGNSWLSSQINESKVNEEDKKSFALQRSSFDENFLWDDLTHILGNKTTLSDISLRIQQQRNHNTQNQEIDKKQTGSFTKRLREKVHSEHSSGVSRHPHVPHHHPHQHPTDRSYDRHHPSSRHPRYQECSEVAVLGSNLDFDSVFGGDAVEKIGE